MFKYVSEILSKITSNPESEQSSSFRIKIARFPARAIEFLEKKMTKIEDDLGIVKKQIGSHMYNELVQSDSNFISEQRKYSESIFRKKTEVDLTQFLDKSQPIEKQEIDESFFSQDNFLSKNEKSKKVLKNGQFEKNNENNSKNQSLLQKQHSPKFNFIVDQLNDEQITNISIKSDQSPNKLVKNNHFAIKKTEKIDLSTFEINAHEKNEKGLKNNEKFEQFDNKNLIKIVESLSRKQPFHSTRICKTLFNQNNEENGKRKKEIYLGKDMYWNVLREKDFGQNEKEEIKFQDFFVNKKNESKRENKSEFDLKNDQNEIIICESPNKFSIMNSSKKLEMSSVKNEEFKKNIEKSHLNINKKDTFPENVTNQQNSSQILQSFKNEKASEKKLDEFFKIDSKKKISIENDQKIKTQPISNCFDNKVESIKTQLDDKAIVKVKEITSFRLFKNLKEVILKNNEEPICIKTQIQSPFKIIELKLEEKSKNETLLDQKDNSKSENNVQIISVPIENIKSPIKNIIPLKIIDPKSEIKPSFSQFQSKTPDIITNQPDTLNQKIAEPKPFFVSTENDKKEVNLFQNIAKNNQNEKKENIQTPITFNQTPVNVPIISENQQKQENPFLLNSFNNQKEQPINNHQGTNFQSNPVISTFSSMFGDAEKPTQNLNNDRLNIFHDVSSQQKGQTNLFQSNNNRENFSNINSLENHLSSNQHFTRDNFDNNNNNQQKRNMFLSENDNSLSFLRPDNNNNNNNASIFRTNESFSNFQGHMSSTDKPLFNISSNLNNSSNNFYSQNMDQNNLRGNQFVDNFQRSSGTNSFLSNLKFPNNNTSNPALQNDFSTGQNDLFSRNPRQESTSNSFLSNMNTIRHESNSIYQPSIPSNFNTSQQSFFPSNSDNNFMQSNNNNQIDPRGFFENTNNNNKKINYFQESNQKPKPEAPIKRFGKKYT